MGLFLDEKDISSKLILSHVYLLIGLSYPLWISNKNGKYPQLAMFSRYFLNYVQKKNFRV